MSAIRKTLLALGLTIGIIMPVGVLSKPEGGYRWPLVKENRAYPRSEKRRLSLLISSLPTLDLKERGPLVLSPEQAHSFCEVLKPWQKKRSMSEPEAGFLFVQLGKLLKPPQRRELEQGMGSPFGSGAGRSDQFFSGQQRRVMNAFREKYNPFYPPQTQEGYFELMPEIRQRYAERFVAREAVLTELARKARDVKAKSLQALPHTS